MTIKIDKGVPIPKNKTKKRIYDFEAMRVGDSFFSKKDPQPGQWARDHKPSWSFSTRKATENGVDGYRTWRIT